MPDIIHAYYDLMITLQYYYYHFTFKEMESHRDQLPYSRSYKLINEGGAMDPGLFDAKTCAAFQVNTIYRYPLLSELLLSIP